MRFIYFITWEKAQVFNCPPSASQTVGGHFSETMRLVITILLIYCIPAEGQTSLYIVGAVHKSSKNFNSDSITSILTRLKPDLILLELDSSFFDKDFKFKFKPRSNENVGTKEYISKHPTLIRPYDIKGRHLGANVTALEIESLDRLRSIEWELDSTQNKTYRELLSTNNELISFLKKNPYKINQKYVYDLVERNQILMYKGLLGIIESRKEMEDITIGFKQCGIYWDWRNKRMVENTLFFLNLDNFKNKTIVLFTGFFHKYYFLNELLAKQEQYGFLIKEYYQ